MTQGATGVVSATVVPSGSPITWASDNEQVATVDSGNVIAVAAGTATISATITVEGMEYSDTAIVTVEAGETVVFDYQENWNDASLWVKRDYTQDTRKTFVELDADGSLVLTGNEGGSNSSLYMDAAPSADGFTIDAGKTYELELSIENDSANAYTVTIVAGSASVFSCDNSPISIDANYSGVMHMPLTINHEGAARIITIQVRAVGDVVNAYVPFNVRVIEN